MASRPASASTIVTNRTNPSLISSKFTANDFIIGNSTVKQRILDVFKLVTVTAPLVIALLILASLSMTTAKNKSNESDMMVDSLQIGDKMSFIINSLQKERGMTCVYLNSQNSTTVADVEQQMRQFQDDTDMFIDDLDVWIETGTFHTKKEFRYDIKVFRLKIPREVTGCQAVLDYYTALIDYLFSAMGATFGNSISGHFWIALNGYNDILKVKDLIGLKRATGGAFFAAAEYDTFALQEFIGLTNTANTILSGVGSTLPEVHDAYENMTMHNRDLIELLHALEEEIYTQDPINHQADSNKSLLWFDTVTDYMKLYTQLEQVVLHMVEQALRQLGLQSKRSYDINLWIVVTVSVICPPLLIVYFANYQSLMSKVKRFTNRIKQKQTDVKAEKQKAEVLLHQLIPKALAKDIQAGRTIMPEQFDSVTVFFSDIHGFSALSASSTPFQTVEILNKLYATIDGIIEVYDAYKVETISSSYLVASGLPIRNDHHSEQICSMALDVLRTMSYFNIPHKPWENLLIRIGCHTGPLAAGVVGLKMPRYCVFGDTVNTAARVETTGYPNRIQISWACKQHLDYWFPDEFQTMYGEKLAVKGKGDIETYWILGRKGNIFKMSLEKSEAILDFTEYWKEETNTSCLTTSKS